MRAILEDVLGELMFTAPSDETITKITITDDCVNGLDVADIERDLKKRKDDKKESAS